MTRRWTVAALSLAVLALGLLVWALTLRQEARRLQVELRTARRGARPALPPPPRADAPADLKRENDRLRHELEQATVPQLNVPTVTPPSDGAALTLPPGAPALLVLRPPARPAPSEYRLRALAHDGSVVWEGAGLRRTPEGLLTAYWPGSLVQPGDYRLELFGPAPTDRRLATFQLTVRADEGGAE